MPQVNINVIGTPPSDRQKAAIFTKITDLMVNVLGRTKNLVLVSLSSSPVSDWAVGGEASKANGLIGVQAVIRIIAAASSDEQKSRMIAETTAVLRRELGEPILPLYVTFEEVLATAWGYNGRTVAEISATKAA